MAIKTTSEIANLFFQENRPSRLETEDIWTHIAWREWSYFLTKKQGDWLMKQANNEENAKQYAHAGKWMVKGRFERNGVTFFFEATEVGRNNQLMFKVSVQEKSYSENKEQVEGELS